MTALTPITRASTTPFADDSRILLTDTAVNGRSAKTSVVTLGSTTGNISGVGSLGVTSIDLGSTDTTLTRDSSGVVAVEGSTLITASAAATLTNKTIDLTNNTLTGSVTEFNTALESASFGTFASTSLTDHAAVRLDGATGALQNSGVIIDDSNNVSGIAALSITSIELGHASDTTLTRSSSGVVAIEGVDVATVSGSQTLTNKGIDLTNNTLVGSVAEFNTALESAIFGTFASTTQTDHAAVRSDGASGVLQTSTVIIDDSGNVSGIGTLAAGVPTFSANTNGTVNATLANASIGNASASQSVVTAGGNTIALGARSTAHAGGQQVYIITSQSIPIIVYTAGTERMRVDALGNVLVNTGALSTAATDGILYIPTSTGGSTTAPIGTPTAYTGLAPMVYSSALNRLFIYNGAWRSVALSS